LFCPAGGNSAFHCVRHVLPVPRWPVCGLASPQPLRPHAPTPATGGRDPHRGPSAFARGRAAVSPARLARPVPADSGVIGHPRHRRNLSTHPKTLLVPSLQNPDGREGGGENRPAGGGSHAAGACGHPTRWPSWGNGAAASRRRRGATRRAALSGRARRRVGGLGSRPGPSDCSEPAGQRRKPPRSGNTTRKPRRRHNKGLTQ